MTTTVLPIEYDTVGRETRRRIAARLLPFLVLLYVVNFLDRTSIAYAALGMSQDLHFNSHVIGLAAGTFFLGYVAMQVPGAMLVQLLGARRAISAILVVWGALTVLTALVQTPFELYAARFVLGVAESGFFPGVIVYLGRWFLSQDRAKATSNFFTAVPISLMAASPVAGWIVGQHWLGVAGWRWLFAAEGLPAVVLGGAAFLWLTDEPQQATWLDVAHRGWIEGALAQEQAVQTSPSHIWAAVKSPLVLLLAACAFLEYAANYSVIYFLPTILQKLSGLSDAKVGLLGALPYAATLLTVVVVGWHSDRTGERRWHCMVLLILGASGVAALAVHPGSVALTVALLAVTGATTLAFVPLFWSLVPDLLGASRAAVAIGTINAIASVGGFVGPLAFGDLTTSTGSFAIPLLLVAALTAVAGLLILRVPRPR